MADIVQFKPRVTLEPEAPHCTGAARCLDCRHEWQAVAPLATTWMQCPACTLLRGRFVNPVHTDADHWHCNCGNDLFHVDRNGIYCPNCGDAQRGFV